MLEIEKALGEMQEHLEACRSDYKKAWNEFLNAERSFERAKQIREDTLQSVLKEKGLAICCSSGHNPAGIEHPSVEQLGIYPRDQMRLHFYQMGPYDTQGEYEDSTRTTVMISLYCPKHFPQDKGWKIEGENGFTNIDSEVVQQDGKYILTIDESDITKLINKGGSHIEPNGKKYLDTSVYRHFGIPDLPEKPRLDTLR